MIERADVEEAAARVAAVIRPTPVHSADAISKVVGRPVLFKPEHRQRTGSFKIRGAYNRISRLDPTTTPAVVAASAGNHAQGVALAAARTGIPSTIFMPSSVSLPKLQATRDYGASVELVAGTVEDAIVAALAHAEATGALWVPPFDDPFIIAGQGTVGLEIAVEAPEAEVVLVPVGGGGLLAGIAVALAGTGVRVIGVEPAGAACMRASLDAGAIETLAGVATMADGVAVKGPSALTFEHARALVDDIVTVSEEDISRAVLLLLERAKSVVEPAGALGLAALLAGVVPGGGPAVAVLSGGNVDPMLLTRLVEFGLTAAGRYLVLQVVLADRPGQLAALSATIAELQANVLSIEHHRAGVGLALGDAQVRLMLEARDQAHGDQLIEALTVAGFTVA
ncbi:MAG: Threonine dehydratase, partial [Acidimicrobiales bacterium]|nr:Threonine dehydratase [Acidimicrobiales bacterium]